MNTPPQYQWLHEIGTLPRMVQEALAELGTIETPGAASSGKILAWAREVGVSNVYTADSIPWCGLFMAVVAKRAGKALVSSPLWALSWSKFGEQAGQPRLGDVLTFTRNGGGHVALYIGEDNEAYHVLGGNQSDSVCFTRIPKIRLYRARRPHYNAMPDTAKPFILKPQGGLSSTEA